MDINRASQIIDSEKIITVLHNGAPVWLESLNYEEKKARVNSLGDNQEGIKEIPVGELLEA